MQSLLAKESEAIKAELSQRCYLEYKEYNSRLPVNRLPPELLLLIFEFLVQKGARDYGKLYSQLHQLALVCSHWSAFVKKSPSLWSRIHCDTSELPLETILRKSGGGPLCIVRCCQATLLPLILQQHYVRCRSMFFAYSSADEQTLITAERMPLLKYLIIDQGLNGPNWTSPFNSLVAPNIQGFSLRRTCLSAYAMNFSTLKFLHLSEMFRANLSLDDVASILTANMLLEHVVLEMVQSSREVVPEVRDPITLPLLKTLAIVQSGATLPAMVIGALQAPLLKNLNINTHSYLFPNMVDEQFKNPVLMRRILSSKTLSNIALTALDIHVVVHTSSTWSVRSFEADYQTLETDYHVVQTFVAPMALDVFWETLGESVSTGDLKSVETSVHVGIQSYGVTPMLTGALLRCLNAILGHLTGLCIDLCRTEDKNAIVQLSSFLSQKVDGRKVDGAWPFPALRNLDLSWDEADGAHILSMVRTRFRKSGLPPLTRLNLRGVTAPSTTSVVIAKIAAALPPGAVCSEGHRMPKVAKCWGQSREPYTQWL